VETLPLLEANRFLPELSAVPRATWERAALVWVNYPNNPTGVTAPLELYEELATLAREHGFVLGSDEAYTELWQDEPPPSALQVSDLSGVAVFNTLSKRSSMTGYRSAFVAGDPAIVAALKAFRPTVGTAPQEFVQRASVVAWGDEEHVARARRVYSEKRALVVDALERAGLRVAGGTATMYVWVAAPKGATSESFATHLLDHGIVVAPGSYLGQSGEGYVRLALVPTLEECARAAEIFENAL
jgi:acetylornithine aminotransferase